MANTEGVVKIRKATVAGKFYPGTGSALSAQISEIHTEEIPKIDYRLRGTSCRIHLFGI